MAIFISICTFCTWGISNAQKLQVKGIVANSQGERLPGVTIQEEGSTNGVITNEKGGYELSVQKGAVLKFSYIGYETQHIKVSNYEADIHGVYEINITMTIKANNELNETVIVGYGVQKRSTVVGSVTSVEPKLLKGPTSNLTTMLAGRISGMIAFQRSGEPGKNTASFFIRGVGTFGAGKVNPLILIDGIESTPTDLARLQPDDISGFSILKDATATAVYGARGANGVIVVRTKKGDIGKMEINIRIENSNSSNTQNIDLADNISFMKLANEAVLTRNPLNPIPYNRTKIDHTIDGDNPLLYPNNHWIDRLIKNSTNNLRTNINVSGGTEKARYYLSGSYSLDNGNLKSNSLNGFNNNIKLQTYSVLSNVTINITNSTKVLVSLKGRFDDYSGPIGGGSAVYNSALWSNPVAFPAVYPSDMLPFEKHPLFGNAIMRGTTTALYNNPYAQSLSGFQSYNTSDVTAQLIINQALDVVTPGLSARLMAYTTRYAHSSLTRQVSPFYYKANVSNGVLTGLTSINDGSPGNPFPAPTEYLTYSPRPDTVNSTFYTQLAINFGRNFGKNNVTGMLIGILRNYRTGHASSLQLALPHRNVGVSGRFTYGYDDRYLVEFDFGYNGSERFAANHRWGFFPSAGAGWVVSNERFFEPLKDGISHLKLRATYGLVGNDQIGNPGDRFFYLSRVRLVGTAGYGNFGEKFTYSRPTVAIDGYKNPEITWEKSTQTNIGLDATFLNNFQLTIDAYHQYRNNILMVRGTVPIAMGLRAPISANTGEASSGGVDIALKYNKVFKNSLWIEGRANFTYAKSKVLVNEEPDYSTANANLSHIGNSMNQIYGLIAERLFVDKSEVTNSPDQFGDIMAGDIKYKDINGDDQVSIADYVPIGFPTVPEIVYGFGFSIGYKNFDISTFFQGVGRTSFLIDPRAITPFANQNGLLGVIARDHWSENDRDLYAFWPRLNRIFSENNDHPSTWWLRNGAFLRLKMAEVGYNIPKSVLQKVNIKSCRIYVNGTNLFTLSAFDLWDPEMGRSGLGYPIQKVINAGILIGL